MKIAIIGASPMGINAALCFQDLGANVVLFEKNQLGGLLSLKRKLSTNNSFISEELKLIENQKSIFELDVLISKMNNFTGEIKYKKVNRLHKRFLSDTESIVGRSRLADLFRIVYQGRYSDEIEKQRSENLDFFSKLDAKMIESLKCTLEHFTDVDLVIDTTQSCFSPNRMGPGGVAAINEEQLAGDRIFYGLSETLNNLEHIRQSKNITLVGDSFELIYTLLCLEDEIFKGLGNISIITNRNPLWKIPSDFSDQKHHFFKKKIEDFISKDQKIWDEKIKLFEADTFKWRNLENYEKAKIAAPRLPKRKVEIYEKCNVTNVDKLIDKNEIFLTFESPNFRNQSAEEILKTIPTDVVCVFNGVRNFKNEFHGNMLAPTDFTKNHSSDEEIGFYIISNQNEKIEDIKNNVLKYFGKKDE